MNIGVKFCGGCNPHYDRTAILNKLIEIFKEDKFEYAKNNNIYDVVIVLNGCSRACSDHSSLKGKEKIFINSEEDYIKAFNILKRRMED